MTTDDEHAALPSRGGVSASASAGPSGGLDQRPDDERMRTAVAAGLFAAALLSGTITTAILMSAGFRPYRLDPWPATVWLSGSGLAVIGTVLLGWASCQALQSCARAVLPARVLVIRVGVAAFLAGTGAASLTELFSPISLTTR